MQPDDDRLTVAIQAAQNGDEAAFRTVYRAIHPRLLGYVRTLVGEAEAEDVASETWLQITRDLDRFSGDADRFRGWTARIARNRALDHVRMRGRRPATGGDESELTDRPGDADTADAALEALGTDRTFRLLARLPQDQAEAVALRVVVGLDAKSAAGVLGKRPGAVRTAAHRGLRRLAELITGDRDRYGSGDGGREGKPEDGAPERNAPGLQGAASAHRADDGHPTARPRPEGGAPRGDLPAAPPARSMGTGTQPGAATGAVSGPGTATGPGAEKGGGAVGQVPLRGRRRRNKPVESYVPGVTEPAIRTLKDM
ncbi:sigma-70 family RNA polymerase sigma factor [Streptomyces sp. NPDC003077]|uniref:RNA polymerase sigma factor n=1 Tax=Streptomyces sp. NPDC003077 TaxID=3154443 RepID=UPI0033B5EC79